MRHHELEGGEVVETPGEGQLDEAGLAAPDEGTVGWRLVADPAVVGTEIVAHHAAVIKEVPVEEAIQSRRHQRGGGRSVAHWSLPGDTLEGCGRAIEIALFFVRSL